MIKYSKKQKLEKQLIQSFKSDFFNKLGYYPIVKVNVLESIGISEETDDLYMMQLSELEDCFIETFPDLLYGKYKMRSKDRYRFLVDLRSIFSHFARTMGYTYASIGEYLGGKHHSTVLHYQFLFKNEMETNERFRSFYYRILHTIKQKTKQDESSAVVDTN
jgi:hypothetical protein